MRAWIVSFVVAAALLAGDVDVRAEEARTPSERARIAILPMVVNTAGEQSYLRSGLADMLASRLGRNAALAVVRVEDEGQATTDPQRAAEAGRERGVDYVVFGSFTQFGDGASLDVQCLSVRGFDEEEQPEMRRVFIQSGTVGKIIPELDATAGKIGQFVAGSQPAPAAELPPVAGGPPAPEALAPIAAGGNEAGFEDLQRRIETIEDYLFGGGPEEQTTGTGPEEPASQDSRLR